MLLIRKLHPTDYEQQLAGLLHDISHTAFSHLIDIILSNKMDDFHETILDTIINAPNNNFIGYIENDQTLMQILEEFDMQIVIEKLKMDKYTLLEKDLPLLCADRIDYTLRDSHCYKLLNSTQEDFERMVSTLCKVAIDGEEIISFNEKELPSAELFMETYKFLVVDFFLGLPNLYFNDLVGDLLRECINTNIISVKDMIWGDDMYCLTKVFSHPQRVNTKISEIIQTLKHRAEIVNSHNVVLVEKDSIENYVEIVCDPTQADYTPKRKKRVVDFKIQTNYTFKFISECSTIANNMFIEMSNQENILLPMKRIFPPKNCWREN